MATLLLSGFLLLHFGAVDKDFQSMIDRFVENEAAFYPCSIRFHSEDDKGPRSGECICPKSGEFYFHVGKHSEYFEFDGAGKRIGLEHDGTRLGVMLPETLKRPWGDPEPRDFLGLRSFDLPLSFRNLIQLSTITAFKPKGSNRSSFEILAPNGRQYRFVVQMAANPIIVDYEDISPDGVSFARVDEMHRKSKSNYPSAYVVGSRKGGREKIYRRYTVDSLELSASDVKTMYAARRADRTIKWRVDSAGRHEKIPALKTIPAPAPPQHLVSSLDAGKEANFPWSHAFLVVGAVLLIFGGVSIRRRTK